MDVSQLSTSIASDDPVVGLRAVLALRRLAEQVEVRQVTLARQQGWSWQQIGDALGITRQSVHAKYARIVK
ncbi:MAG: helix-turn-helix domain-containing protein [Nakamurella sp.]